MSLFDDEVRVPCTADEWALIFRPVTGTGGMQRLIRKIQACVIAERTLLIEPRLLDKAWAYAYNYGSGGLQDRFQAVMSAALRTGQWAADGSKWRQRRKQGTGRQFGSSFLPKS